MKISLATNFDDELIEKIKVYNNVYEIYGRMSNDLLNGGRPNNTIKAITKKKFENHVKIARLAGINFNYLFNGACDSNKSQNKKWQKKFNNFILYLKSVGVNAFTITNPLVLKQIKKYYPESICRVSTFACVDTFEKAKYWQDMGADIICVDFVKINRDFKVLKLMVDGLKKSKIEILCTNSCIKNCPYIHTHVNCIAHASEGKNKNYIDWCLLSCQYQELKNLEEYIKSPWVRPEDVKFYEEIGIEHFKITERDFPTEILLERLKAYSERKYSGNLLNLIQGHGFNLDLNKIKPIEKKSNFNNIQEVLQEIYRVRGYKREREAEQHCFIDNVKLDKFILHFINGNCSGSCKDCNYCKNIANKTITRNSLVSDYLIELYEKYEKMLY